MTFSSCPACAKVGHVAGPCSAKCERAIKAVRGLHTRRNAENKVIVPAHAPVARIFAAVCRAGDVDAAQWQNRLGEYVLPGRMVDGIGASIALRHIGTNGGGAGEEEEEKRGTKRGAGGRGAEEQEEEEERRILAKTRQDLEQYGAVGKQELLDISRVPIEHIAHILPELDYSAIVRLRGVSRELKAWIDARHVLFNFTNTKFLLGNLVNACMDKDLALLETCMRSCANVMPQLFPAFIGTLMGLCCYMRLDKWEEPKGLQKVVYDLIQARSDFRSAFLKEETEAENEAITWDDEDFNMRLLVYSLGFAMLESDYALFSTYATGQVHMHGYRSMSSSALTMATSLLYIYKNVNHSAHAEAKVMREFVASALRWLYLDQYGPKLDPDKTIFATCWLDPKIGRFTDPDGYNSHFLPATASTALEIMSLCQCPEATVAAFVLSTHEESDEGQRLPPACFDIRSMFCLRGALLLTNKAGFLRRYVHSLCNAAPLNLVFVNKALNEFFLDTDMKSDIGALQKGVADFFVTLSRSPISTRHLGNTAERVTGVLIRIVDEWKTKWQLPIEGQPVHDLPAPTQPESDVSAAMNLLDKETIRLYGRSERAFLHALYTEDIIPAIRRKEARRTVRPTVLLLAVGQEFRKIALQSYCVQYILNKKVDFARGNIKEFSEETLMHACFWLSLVSTRIIAQAETLASHIANLKDEIFVEQTFNVFDLLECRVSAREENWQYRKFESITENDLKATASAPSLLSNPAALLAATRATCILDLNTTLPRGYYDKRYENFMYVPNMDESRLNNYLRILNFTIFEMQKYTRMLENNAVITQSYKVMYDLRVKSDPASAGQLVVKANAAFMPREQFGRVLRAIDWVLMQRRRLVADEIDPSRQFMNPSPQTFYGQARFSGVRIEAPALRFRVLYDPATRLSVTYDIEALRRIIKERDLPQQTVVLAEGGIRRFDFDTVLVPLPGTGDTYITATQAFDPTTTTRARQRAIEEEVLRRTTFREPVVVAVIGGKLAVLAGDNNLVRAMVLGLSTVKVIVVPPAALAEAAVSSRVLSLTSAAALPLPPATTSLSTAAAAPATSLSTAAAAAAAAPLPAPATSLSVAPPSTPTSGAGTMVVGRRQYALRGGTQYVKKKK